MRAQSLTVEYQRATHYSIQRDAAHKAPYALRTLRMEQRRLPFSRTLIGLMVVSVLLAPRLVGQTATAPPKHPSIKGHRIGESAQDFFAVAQMGESRGKALDYCRTYLADPKVVRAYEKAQKDITNLDALQKSSDVNGCREVLAALEGKSVNVGARYATEIGKGSVTFENGKLVAMDLMLDAMYNDVLADMTKKLGAAPNEGQDILQNAYGAQLVQRYADWPNAAGLTVRMTELRSFRVSEPVTSVIVADADYVLRKKKERDNSRPSTLN